MSESAIGSKGNKVTKFTNWSDSERLQKNGKNAFKVFRKLKKQLKAEAYSGKATALEQYPAVAYKVKFPEADSWLPIDPTGNSPIIISLELQEKLKAKVFENYIEEVRDYAKQDEKIYELLIQQVCSQDSLEVIKADPAWKTIDSQEVQSDWISFYNLMIKTHVIQIGGVSSEAKLIAANDTRYELYHFKQGSTTSSSQHFEDHEDLINKCKMLGMVINEQELSFLLINSMYHRASREKREFDLKMGTPLPNLLSTTYTYIRHAENLHKSILTINGALGGRDTGLNRALATEEVSYRSNGTTNTGRLSNTTVRRLRNANRSKYTPEERRRFNALSEAEKEAEREKNRAQNKTAGKKAGVTSNNSSQEKRVCYKCNKPGHIAKDCRSKVDLSEQKVSMMVTEENYDEYDRYDSSIGENHEAYVTRKVHWLDSNDLDDLSSIDSIDNTYLNCTDNKPTEAVTASWAHPNEACLVMTEEEGYSSEGNESIESKEIRELLNDTLGASRLTKVAYMPSVQDLKQHLDFIHQEKVFMAMGGGHKLVRCEGILVEENGAYDIRNVPIERVIDNWQDRYLKDTHTSNTTLTKCTTKPTLSKDHLPERSNVQGALGQYVDNKVAEIHTKINTSVMSEKKNERPNVKANPRSYSNNKKMPEMATTVRIPFYPKVYPDGYNKEDYKQGQRWILANGTLSDYHHRIGEMIEIDENGRDVKPDHPCGDDRSSCADSVSKDSLHMYNYIPGAESEPSEASGSVYTEVLPPDLELGSRKSTRLHPETTQRPYAQDPSTKVSLDTGLVEWEDEHIMLKERIREEIYKEIGISPEKASNKGRGARSPEKVIVPAHEEIWNILESVRIQDEDNCCGDRQRITNLNRNVLKHREILRSKGVMHYVNNTMMKKIVNMGDEAHKSIKEMIEEKFRVIDIGGDQKKWKIISNEMKMTDGEAEEVSLLFDREELEGEFENTNLVTTGTEESEEKSYPSDDSVNPRGKDDNSSECRVEASAKAREVMEPYVSGTVGKKGEFLTKLNHARRDLVSRFTDESKATKIMDVTGFKRFTNGVSSSIYSVVREMVEWEDLSDYTCIFVVAALEYEGFPCTRTDAIYLENRIRRWYLKTKLVGVSKVFHINLPETCRPELTDAAAVEIEHAVRKNLFSPIIDLTADSDSSSDKPAREASSVKKSANAEATPTKKIKVEKDANTNLVVEHKVRKNGVLAGTLIDKHIFDYKETEDETRIVGQIDCKILEHLKNTVAQSVGLDTYLLEDDLWSIGSWASGITFNVGEFNSNTAMVTNDAEWEKEYDNHIPYNDIRGDREGDFKRRRRQLEEDLNNIAIDSSTEESSKASDYEVEIYNTGLNMHTCLVTSALEDTQRMDENSEESSDSSEVSNDSNEDSQIGLLTFPPEHLDLQKRVTNLYQISLRNDEFRRYRTDVVEEAQLAGARIRARAMSNMPGETEETIREYMKDFTVEAFADRRTQMATSSILPNTIFWGLDSSHLYFIIEDALGDFHYNVRSFNTEEERMTYFQSVHRRHASMFPVSNEGEGGTSLHSKNTNIVIVSPEQFSVIMKECYMMSDHTSNDTPSQNKDSNQWWHGDPSRGTRYWNVTDWVSVCSSLAHVLPIIAMAYLSKDRNNRDSVNSSNLVYRKCIQFMIWCFNLGNNINNAVDESKEKILLTLDTHMYVILDSGSTAHMVRDAGLLTNVRRMPKPAFIGGVENGGNGITCHHWGDMLGVKRVMYSDRSSANILSLSALKDKGHSVKFDNEGDKFVVKFIGNEKVYEFVRDQANGTKSRHYGCKIERQKDETVYVGTVKDNLRQYTVAEVEKARVAREQANMLGFVSTEAHCNMIKSGDIQNNSVTVADVYRALKIWGPSIPTMMGKTKQSAPPKALMETLPPAQHEKQVLEIDVFFVQEIPFLIGVLNPMCYCMSAELKNRSETQIRGVLLSMISACRANNIDITAVRSDNEKGLIALKNDIQIAGIKLELAPPGGHVPLPERKICQVKSIIRATKASVPWEMPRVVMVFSVLFATSCINYQRITAKPYVMSPYQQFTGTVIDNNLHLKSAFGSYAQATVATTDNSMNPRTHSAIVLGPTLNKTGSYKVLELSTWKVVTRHKIKILPTPGVVTDFMNKRALEDFDKNRMKRDPIGGDIDVVAEGTQVVKSNTRVGGRPFDGREWYDTHLEHRSDLAVNKDATQMEREEEPNSQDQREHNPDQEQQETYDEYWTEEMLQPEHPIHRNTNHRYPLRSMRQHHTLVMSVKSAISEHGKAAEDSVRKELQQMIDKQVWHPVDKSSLNSKQISGIIRSSMFLKEKYDSTGKFEKLKARLVANGNMQDKTIYGDNMSSPTSALSSVFAIAAIAAHENRSVKTLDIGGAYLNADMHKTGIDVFMRLDGKMVDILCEMNSTYNKYRVKSDKGDYIVVNLDRALYGCVESAKLWYDDLKGTLYKAGYKVNALDECVFNKGTGDEQCTIALHVDDMIITCRNKQTIQDLITKLKERYTEGITVHEGPIVSYLGMTFDWSLPGQVRVTQEGYIAEMLNSSGVDGMAKTPAAENLYEVREDTPLASEETSEWFHSQVAKALYLCKRTKPECLTAVAFLTTRVTKCNLDDVVKLIRLIKYIRRTKNTGIVLKPGKEGIIIRSYIDAAYGVYDDGKSVTGCITMIGDSGPIHAKSVKQKIVTKSSTEAELVATSDSANQTLHLRQFLIEQGYPQKEAEVFQDNISCMNLLKKGKSCSERTRHMSIRYFWLSEKIRKGEIKLTHIRTEDMCANLLTKPLQGAQFDRERRLLTNWES